MRLALAAALLLPQAVPSAPETAEAVRDALQKSLKDLDRGGVDRACGTLVRLGDERTVEWFIAAFRAGLQQAAALDKERLKLVKEMEKVETAYDKDGRLLRGDPSRWQALKYEHDLLAAKLDVLTGAVPRIAGRISKIKNPPPIIQALGSTPEWYPRACCAEALGGLDQPEAVAALVARARIETEPGVRIALSDALSARTATQEEAYRALVPWLQGGTWSSRLAAAQALTRSGNRKLVPLLIPLLSGATGRMKYEINECLKKLTRADRHGDFTAWQAWWDANENEFLAGTYVPTKADMADGPGMTTFYGIPLHSSRVVFIIDVSVSMKDPTTWRPEVHDGTDKLEGERAIDVARYELRKIIRSMPEGTQFDIIGMYGRLAMLSEKWVVAARDAREKSIKFVQALELRSGTDVHGAIIRALDFSGGNWNTPPREESIDTIFILTDGTPSVGLLDRAQIPERILDAARFKRIAITTIAIDAQKDGREILKKIAEGTGGDFATR